MAEKVEFEVCRQFRHPLCLPVDCSKVHYWFDEGGGCRLYAA